MASANDNDFPPILPGGGGGGPLTSNVIDSNYRRMAYDRYARSLRAEQCGDGGGRGGQADECPHRQVFKANVNKFFASHRLWISLGKKSTV